MSPRVWLACAAAVTIAGTARADEPEARRGSIQRLEHAATNPTLGPRGALVTIELYFVPGSDEGHRAYAALAELAARHPTRLRAVFRPRQFGARHQVAALAIAAHRQGRFFALLDALAARPYAPSPAASYDLAVSLGLDRELLRRADRDPAILAIIAGNERRAFLAPTTEVPEYVINGQPTSSAPVRITAGNASVAQLEPLYQAALADARVAAAQGVRRGAMPHLGRWETWCTADEPPPPAPPPSWLLRERPDPPPRVADDPGPRFAWHLGRLVDRGTACPPPEPVPGRLDDYPDGFEPVPAGAPLVEAPLPTGGAPAYGPPDAPVPIVVVCNLRGDHCRSQLGLLRPLVDVYEGRVRLVWLPAPAPAEARPEEHELLSQQAMCAAALGDGWPFSSDPSGVTNVPVAPEHFARVAGADVDDVLACAEADRGPVRRAVAAVEAAGIVSNPTVVIGGRAYTGGFVDARAAAAVIERALAPGLLDQVLGRGGGGSL